MYVFQVNRGKQKASVRHRSRSAMSKWKQFQKSS